MSDSLLTDVLYQSSKTPSRKRETGHCFIISTTHLMQTQRSDEETELDVDILDQAEKGDATKKKKKTTKKRKPRKRSTKKKKKSNFNRKRDRTGKLKRKPRIDVKTLSRDLSRKARRKRNNSIKLAVFRGHMNRTAGGLTQSDIIRRKTGSGFRIVSKRRSELAKKHPWIVALAEAKKQLHAKNPTKFPLNKMVLVRIGTPLYVLAKKIQAKNKK